MANIVTSHNTAQLMQHDLQMKLQITQGHWKRYHWVQRTQIPISIPHKLCLYPVYM